MSTMRAPTETPGRLRLPDLEVSGFRAFDRLVIPRLGRVNLFVGPNSAGKSSLLEALRLYASGGSPGTLMDILASRDEMSPRTLTLSEEDIEILTAALSQLFHRSDPDNTVREISTGPVRGERTTVERGWIVRVTLDEPQRFVTQLSNVDLMGGPRRALQIGSTAQKRVVPLQGLTSFLREVPWPDQVPSVYVSANGLDAAMVAELWDRIALTEQEESVLDALRIIAPVERLSLVGDYDGRGERKPLVKVPGSRKPVRLRSLGDGMSRLLGIALALANARGGFLFVDEVENGLHVSVQDNVWLAIFRLAEQLDVQVFATTHSWDAIVGFQYAANLSAAEGMLYRLERRKDGSILSTAYSERDAEIAARQRIEVR